MEKRIKITVKKGGKLEIETEGFQGQTCRETADMVMATINGATVIGEEERDSEDGDLTQFVNY